MTLADSFDREWRRDSAPIQGPAELLEQTSRFIGSYVVMSSAERDTAALFVAHAHTLEAADVTPYLMITSAEKRSGKTRLLEVLELLVPSPIRTASISDAALFRSLGEVTGERGNKESRPTILLDEADAIFGPKSDREDLRALLNAGYRSGSVVVRCEAAGRGQVVKRYEAFGAKAIAAIRDLPDTIADRSIPLRLKRRKRREGVTRFRFREAQALAEPIRVSLEAWAAGVIEPLRAARPDLPEALNDRAQDGWEPLLAIADLAGGDWPSRARRAAIALQGEGDDTDDETLGVQLLSDIGAIFERRAVEAITTEELVRALVDEGDGPWPEWWGKQAKDGDMRGPGYRLGKLLKPYEIRSKNLSTPTGKRKGFRRDQFEDSWARYRPSPVFPQNDAPDAPPLESKASGGASLFSGPTAEPLKPPAAQSGSVDTSFSPDTTLGAVEEVLEEAPAADLEDAEALERFGPEASVPQEPEPDLESDPGELPGAEDGTWPEETW